ncbi:MAG: cytochrome c [Paracoccaceae bacterium]
MNKLTAALSGLALAASLAAPALAQDLSAAVKARQAQMELYAFNLSLLGGMAKGAVPYDAEAASKAAGNLAALTKLDQSRLWPQGSDNGALGDTTAALPAIWAADSTAMAKGMDLAAAADAMNAAAGAGLDQLQGAMGALGGACGSCHKAYRQPSN